MSCGERTYLIQVACTLPIDFWVWDWIEKELVVRLTSVGQVETWFRLALEIGEVTLDATSETGVPSIAKLLYFLVDRLVMQQTHRCQHCDRDKQKSQKSLNSFQPHMSRQMILLESTYVTERLEKRHRLLTSAWWYRCSVWGDSWNRVCASATT